MLFHNSHESIVSSIENGEDFKTTSYWRHSLIMVGVVGNPNYSLTYKGNYITVKSLSNI